MRLRVRDISVECYDADDADDDDDDVVDEQHATATAPLDATFKASENATLCVTMNIFCRRPPTPAAVSGNSLLY